jgi:hypothetical protein
MHLVPGVGTDRPLLAEFGPCVMEIDAQQQDAADRFTAGFCPLFCGR